MNRATLIAAVSFVCALPLMAQNPAGGGVVVPSGQTAAQAAAQAMGRNVSNDEIAAAIRNSGLSKTQLMDKLKAAGYDTSLASPFFGGGGVGSVKGGVASSDFTQALQQLGLFSGVEAQQKADSVVQKISSAPRLDPKPGIVFGKDIFTRSSTSFDPITSGPVDPAYRLGVGDAVQLVVTGQVELAYQLEMRRDGTVIIPQVGQVSIAGLTLESARAVLKNRMAQSYSGLSSGEARLDLSIARIRSNAVFVIGEAEQPGALQVNALSTVFHALARAGGPSDHGSFRGIEVRRGGQVIRRLDLYDYLLKGDATNDIRTEQGDVIYVPLSTRNVTVIGAVRRQRQFELKQGEGFKDLLGFAGGLLPTASVERVQIDRILPAERRQPGIERVKVDVQLKGDLDSLSRVQLLDGDIVTVFGIGDLRRNVVTLKGEVFQPGDYQWRDGLTIGALIKQAQGLTPWALGDRIKVVRQVPQTGRTQLFSVDLNSSAGQAFALSEFDELEVLDGRLAYPQGRIAIAGAVNKPGERAYVENETLRDAIERSGGFMEDAQWVDVSRRKTGAAYSDTTSIVYSVRIDGQFASSSAASYKLERDDRIFVRSSPGFRSQRMITMSGEFKYPGQYAINESSDRVRDIVTRAGGVLPTAYPESFHLRRDGLDVSVDFAAAMRDERSSNVLLRNGDELVIGENPRTVEVTGAVNKRTLLKWQRGLSVQDYIEMAGGPSERGQDNKAVVQYPSGMSKRVHRVALFFHTSPEVVAGSIITVPLKPESTTTASEAWARAVQTTSALASLIVAVAALKKL